MRKGRFALLFLAGCASGPAPVIYQPCPQGQRFSEATPAGGMGVLRISEGSHLEPILPGGRVQVPSVFGRESPNPDVVLEKVELVHTTLGRGARAEGQASFRAPANTPLFLMAIGSGPQDFWEVNVQATPASFSLGCPADRPRQTVNWAFKLRDRKGRVSNSVQVPVTCTGEPMPGEAPRLDAIDLDYDKLVAGQKTSGVAHLRGTHPPLWLIAESNAPGYGWKSSPIREDRADIDFGVGCRKDRPPQIVRWRFSVQDSFGRASNVIEKPVRCGLCVDQK